MGVERYRYDAYGRRVLAMNFASGTITSQYGHNGQLLYQKNARTGQEKQIDHIYLAGSLIAQREQPLAGGTAVVKYLHTDALGSPVAVTNQAGTVIERMDRPGYTGHVRDTATGMLYAQQRYLHGDHPVFLSVDPVTAYGDPVGHFNGYRYANNNPYAFTDPDGRAAKRRVQYNRGSLSRWTHGPARKTYAFDGAGGRNSGNNGEFQDETRSRYGAQQYDSEPFDGNKEVNRALKDAQKLHKRNKDVEIYALGYSAGGHDAVTFANMLSAYGIPVAGLVLFDPHPKSALGIYNYILGSNVGVALNFYQRDPNKAPYNTFQGSRIYGNRAYNADMTDAGVNHSNIFSKAMRIYGRTKSMLFSATKCLLLCLSLVGCSKVGYEATDRVVEGHVTSSDRQALPAADVVLLAADAPMTPFSLPKLEKIARTKTDHNGHYRLQTRDPRPLLVELKSRRCEFMGDRVPIDENRRSPYIVDLSSVPSKCFDRK